MFVQSVWINGCKFTLTLTHCAFANVLSKYKQCLVIFHWEFVFSNRNSWIGDAENEVEEDIFEDMLEAEIMEQPDRPRLLAAGFPGRSFVDPNTPSRSRPRTTGIFKGNNPLSLVWFKWGSQWWGILKHFPQGRCILISLLSSEKKQSSFII